MGLHEYLYSKTLDRYDSPFYALLFQLMRRADTDNIEKIRQAWPEKYEEFSRRYHAKGGVLPEDEWPVGDDGFYVPLPEVPL
jgi:hypothetical protein